MAKRSTIDIQAEDFYSGKSSTHPEAVFEVSQAEALNNIMEPNNIGRHGLFLALKAIAKHRGVVSAQALGERLLEDINKMSADRFSIQDLHLVRLRVKAAILLEDIKKRQKKYQRVVDLLKSEKPLTAAAMKDAESSD